MKEKLLKNIVILLTVVLLFSSVFAGANITLVNNASSQNINVAQGNITFTGNVTKDFAGHLIATNTHATFWGSNNNISQLYVAFNSSYLFIGIKAIVDGNALMVFLSNNTNSGYGTYNMTNLNAWARNINFTKPMNYFAAVWFSGLNSGMSGQNVYMVNSPVSLSNTTPTAIPISSYFVFNGTNNATEIRVPWTAMFPYGFSGNLIMDISVFIVGGSGPWVGIGIPYYQKGIYSNGNQAEFTINNTIALNFGTLNIKSPSSNPLQGNIIFTGNVTKDFAGHLIATNTHATFWGSNNNISQLYVAFNSSYLFIGIKAIVDGNALMVFLSNNTNSGYGTYNMTNLNAWARNINFTKPMNYFAAVWFSGLNSGMSGQNVYMVNSPVSLSNTTPTAIPISSYFMFNGTNNATEIRVPWTAMFPYGFNGNLVMNISVFIVGGSGPWVGIGIPYYQKGIYSNGTQAEFTINNTIALNFGTMNIPSSVVSKVYAPINLAIILNDHQPLYKIVGSNDYVLPWTEVHATSEYIEQALIIHNFPEINITYELSGSLLYQLYDIYSNPLYNNTYIHDAFIPWSILAQNESLLRNITAIYFNTPNYVYQLNEPAARLYSYLHQLWMSGNLFNEQQFEDAKVLFFLYAISTPLVEGQLGNQWKNSTIWALHNKTSFNQDDLITILNYSKWLTGQVIPAFKDVMMGNSLGSNNVELITTPFYHPLMPLLLMNNISGPMGSINKSNYYSDLVAQLIYGKGQFYHFFGSWPVGVWAPESALSYDVIQALNQSGYIWTQGSEWTLQQSGVDALAYGQPGSNITNMENLYTPYIVIGPNNTKIIVFFRDGYLSNAWGFNYGSMPTYQAVAAFINYLKGIYNAIPMNMHNNTLVTVALDGENWMFMSSFEEDGVPFLEALYKALEENSSYIHTVTPQQYLSTHHNLPVLHHLATGTWNRGNGVSAPYESNPSLTQWAGYPVQNFYWEILNDVRNKVLQYQNENGLVQLENYTAIVQNLTANTKEGNLTRAWNAIYAAEGSDWFFTMAPWTIQGSNTEPFDYIFKGDLIYALQQIGAPIPDYLTAHPVPPYQPESMGEPNVAHTPPINGYPQNTQTTSLGKAYSVSSNNAWSGTIVYRNNSAPSGPLGISEVDVAYDPTNIYIQIYVNGNPYSYINSPDQRLCIYFSFPDVNTNMGNVSFDIPGANFGTRYGNTPLNFPASTLVELAVYTFTIKGVGQYAVFASNGFDQWEYQINDQNTMAYIGQTIQLAIPLSYLGYVPGDYFYMGVFASTLNKTISSISPMKISIPASLSKFYLISTIHNTAPDNGPGNYTYPNQPTQIPPGSLDLQYINVSMNDYDMMWNFTFGQMWNIWNAPYGFSNQIVNVFISENNYTGLTYLGPGPNANSTVPWQYMLYVSGWAVYLQSYKGVQYTSGIEVKTNLSSRTVSVIFPLSVIGNDPLHYRYIIVSGSYDGYGVNGWRVVYQTNTTNNGWQGGGGYPPWSSNIYCYIAPATVNEGNLTQQEALKYSVGHIPVLEPITLPLLPSAISKKAVFNYTSYNSPSLLYLNGIYYEAYVSNLTGTNNVYVSYSSDLVNWSAPRVLLNTEGANSVYLLAMNGNIYVIFSTGSTVNAMKLSVPSLAVTSIGNVGLSNNIERISATVITQNESMLVLSESNGSIYMVPFYTNSSSIFGKAIYVTHGTNASIAYYNNYLYILYIYNKELILSQVNTNGAIVSQHNISENVLGYPSVSISSYGNLWISFTVQKGSFSNLYLMNTTLNGSWIFGNKISVISVTNYSIESQILIVSSGNMSKLVVTWVSPTTNGYSVWVLPTTIQWLNTPAQVSKPVVTTTSTSLTYVIIIAAVIIIIVVLVAVLLIYRKKH